MFSAISNNASVDDLDHLYRIILGRRAEADVLDGYVPVQFSEVVRGLACSKECRERVLTALVQSLDLPHEKLGATDLCALDLWLTQRWQLASAAPSAAGVSVGMLSRVWGEPWLAEAMLQAHGELFTQAQERLKWRLQLLDTAYDRWVEWGLQGNEAWAATCAAWDALATVDDLKCLYWAILGRAVEGRVLDVFQPRPLRETIRGLVCSTEANERILHALVQQRELPHENFSQPQLLEIDAWMSTRLALPQGPAMNANTIAGILARIYAHPGLAQLLLLTDGDLYVHALDALKLRLCMGQARFKGKIEFANREFISGFLVDVAGSSSSLYAEIRCNGQLLSSAAAVNFRPDIQLHFGGNGLAGFRAPWNVKGLSAGVYEFTLHEAGTGIQVGQPYRFNNSFFEQLSVAQRLSKEFDDIKRRLDVLAGIVPQALSYSAFPLEHYDLYRQTHAVRAPDASHTVGNARLKRFTILLDATQVSSTAVRVSTDSIREQAGAFEWQVITVGEHATVSNVATLLQTSDSRFSHANDWAAAKQALQPQAKDATHWVVLLQAGEVLDSQALLWLHNSTLETEAVALYWDEDQILNFGGQLPRRLAKHVEPILRYPFDADSMLELNIVGNSFAVRTDTLMSATSMLTKHLADAKDVAPLALAERERLVWAVFKLGVWQHVPQFLLSRTEWAQVEGEPSGIERLLTKASPASIAPLLPDTWNTKQTPDWTLVPDPVLLQSKKQLVCWKPKHQDAVISILMPTRNYAELVDTCVESLLGLAARPDLLEIIIADNGSDDPATLRYLAKGQQEGKFKVLTIDEPFNWSRLNNRMAKQANGEYLLFLNNDMRMLTRDWDNALRGQLERQHVGAVGARLYYEDMTIQHAGVVFGREGLVAHDALGETPDASFSIEGSRLTRSMPAVTGAFLACRASTFKQVGDFDEVNLPVTFNDVDWCWRLREHNPDMVVLYTPLISLIHYESKSRGFDYMDTEKQARAGHEARRLLLNHGANYPIKPSEHPNIAIWTHSEKNFK